MQRRNLTRFLMATAALNAAPALGSESALGSFECEPALSEFGAGCDAGFEEDEALLGAENNLLQKQMRIEPLEAAVLRTPPQPAARLEELPQPSFNGTYSFLQRDIEVIHRSGAAGAAGAAAPAAGAAPAAPAAKTSEPSPPTASSRPSSVPPPHSPGAASTATPAQTGAAASPNTAAPEPPPVAERRGGQQQQQQQRAEENAGKPSSPATGARQLPHGLRWVQGSLLGILEPAFRLALSKLQAPDYEKLRAGGDGGYELEMPILTSCLLPAALVMALLVTACLRARKEKERRREQQKEELQMPVQNDFLASRDASWAPRKPGQGWGVPPAQLALQGVLQPQFFAAQGALPQHLSGTGFISAPLLVRETN